MPYPNAKLAGGLRAKETRPGEGSKMLAVLAPLAVLAALAVVPAVASANAPEFFQSGSPVPDGSHITFTSEALTEVQVWERVDEQRFECADLTNTGAITGNKEDETTVNFIGCSALGFECHSAGAANGEIVVKANSHLVRGVHGRAEEVVSELLFPKSESFPPREPGEEPDTIAEFTCAGLITIVVRGSLLGEIPPVGEDGNEFTLTFTQAGGVQESGTEYIDDEGNRHTAFLEESINGDEPRVLAWETTDRIVLEDEEEVEITQP